MEFRSQTFHVKVGSIVLLHGSLWAIDRRINAKLRLRRLTDGSLVLYEPQQLSDVLARPRSGVVSISKMPFLESCSLQELVQIERRLRLAMGN